jgi:hypothetical protein
MRRHKAARRTLAIALVLKRWTRDLCRGVDRLCNRVHRYNALRLQDRSTGLAATAPSSHFH